MGAGASGGFFGGWSGEWERAQRGRVRRGKVHVEEEDRPRSLSPIASRGREVWKDETLVLDIMLLGKALRRIRADRWMRAIGCDIATD